MLNRVIGPASPAQRAWLASFPAGVEHASGMAQSGIVVALDPIFAAYGVTGIRASASAISATRAGFVAATGNSRDFDLNVRLRAAVT